MAAERAVPVRLDEGALRRRVESVLREALGVERSVRSLERIPSEFATVFPADLLRVRLDDGRAMDIFLKHLGAYDHPQKAVPETEVMVYRDLLANRGLPVPAFYGACRNERTERYELYMEYIDDWCLKYHPLEEWYRGAAVLAEFQRAFIGREDELRTTEALLVLDEAYYAGFAERARKELLRHTPGLVERLDGVVSRYDPVVRELAGAPPTLVNADLSPRNVVADTKETPTRIVFVDWESAGMGCGVLDIVHLAYGLVGRPRRRMLDAYFKGLEGTPLDPGPPPRRRRAVAAAEGHKALYRIARCNYRGYSRETLETLVRIAERSTETFFATFGKGAS